MLTAAAALQGLLITAVFLTTCCTLQTNSSGANSVKFPESPSEALFSQITTDLHRFTKTGIHIDMVEQPYCSEREPSFRVQVLSGQVYIAGEVIDWTNTQSRNRNVKLQLLDVAQHYRLPDVDFLLLTGDWPPEDRSGQSTGCPLQGPVFMQAIIPLRKLSAYSICSGIRNTTGISLPVSWLLMNLTTEGTWVILNNSNIFNAFPLILVSPESFVLSIPMRSTPVTVTLTVTVTQHSIPKTKPGATLWAEVLDFTKQKLLKQSIIRRPEHLACSPESFLFPLRLHRKGLAHILYINIWHIVTQGYATDDFNLENRHRANVLFDDSPYLSRTKQRRHDHVLLHPDHTFTDWNEANTPGWYQQQYLLAEAARAVPWSTKVSKLFFAGNIDTGNRHIMRDVDLSKYPEFDIRVWNWKDHNSPMKFVKLPEHCKYKYLLNWPGNTYSARLKTLLLCNSTVVHSQREGWVEFWYHTLQHGKNVVLTKGIVETGDVTNKMHKVVKKLVQNEQTAMRIAAAGAELAQKVLSVDNVREYWYRLIVAYAKLQRFEVERHPDSVSLGESLTGPVIWRFEDRTCKMCSQNSFKR